MLRALFLALTLAGGLLGCASAPIPRGDAASPYHAPIGNGNVDPYGVSGGPP